MLDWFEEELPGGASGGGGGRNGGCNWFSADIDCVVVD